MRITMVVPSYPKLSETFLVNKFLGLTDSGHFVTVVCQQRDRPAWKSFKALEARPDLFSRVIETWSDNSAVQASAKLASHLWSIDRKSRKSLLHTAIQERGNLRSAFSELPMGAAIMATRPDIVHFEFGAIAIPYLHLRRILNAKFVASFRGYDLNYVGLEQPDYYSRLFSTMDAIHTLGKDLWNRAIRRGCPQSLPHVLIAPAIDTEFFRAERPREGGIAGTADRPLRIVSIGRLEWKKGYEFSLAAIRALVDRGLHVQYRIVGAGNYQGPLAFCRHQLNLDNVVEFTGPGGQEAVRQEMQAADLLLHPAVSEGFCNAVIEAQSMELPVVCTDADGLAENVAHGESGFVVPRRDSIALADRMEQLARDPDLRVRLGTNGRNRAVRHFRLTDQISAFEAFYHELVHRN